MRPRDTDEPVVPPPVLYHVTPTPNLPGILRDGLVPATRNLVEDHPPRIYLCTGPLAALSLCRQIRSAMVAKGLARRNWAGDFAVIGVDAASAGASYRKDGSSAREGGVYTADPIGAEHLRHVETVDGRALLSANWGRVWNHLAWGRGERPDCLVSLGSTTGLPGHDGWLDRSGGTVDVHALWDVAAPAP